MNAHKTQETQVLSLFRKTWDGFPAGRIIQSESPDFVLKKNRKVSIGIEITRLDELNESIVHETTTGKKALPLLSEVESTLKRKEEKLRFYKKKWLSNYWLIIYSTKDYGKMNKPDQNQVLAFDYVSEFHKIFLFLMYGNKVIELK